MKRLFFFLCLLVCFTSFASAQDLPSRLLDDLNWMEFKKIVPAQVKTVLVTVGTLEPHGVINNGADNLAPVKIAAAIAPDANALIAPHIPYGVTGSMAPYPGALHIPEEAFTPYLRAVLEGMVKNGFRNIVVINGHGGLQTAILTRECEQLALARRVNTLVINWWSACGHVTKEVFGEDGGHAGINETAFIQAINPKLVHKDLYSDALATPNPAPGSWSATPFPSTIGLYHAGQGYPKDFSQKKADEYFAKIVACVGTLIKDTLKKWQMAGFE